jgi:hypothetical protein
VVKVGCEGGIGEVFVEEPLTTTKEGSMLRVVRAASESVGGTTGATVDGAEVR